MNDQSSFKNSLHARVRKVTLVRVLLGRGSLAFLLPFLFAGCQPENAQKPPLPPSMEDTGDKPGKSQVGQGIPLERLKNAVASNAGSNPPGGSLRFALLPPDLRPNFSYMNGSRGHRLMVEATGGGCAWLDIDRDGAWDLYLVQGGIPDEKPAGSEYGDQLWRHREGRFIDVTSPAGLQENRYGQGVSAGDFDNDGFEDLFVTNIGGNQLFRNQGDGTLELVDHWGGEDSRLWSTSSAWGDIDSDGDLDLYVCNYVDFDPFDPKVCLNESGETIQCGPNQVDPVPDEMYLNDGAGLFQPSAETLQLKGPGNRALGVVIADFVGDSVPEIYVANDATANFLFQREADGTYTDVASRLGCALDSNGSAQASMGIAPGDFNRDGMLDLYLTHFEGEWNTLYQNFGEFGFRDVTADVQGVQPTLPWVGFGTVMEDFDQNGNDDIFIANGHIDDLGRKRVLEMPPQLLSFDGRILRDVSSESGEYFATRKIGRGCSQADFDNDGDLDLAVVHHSRPAEILVNESDRGHWISIDLSGTVSNRQGIGSKVIVRQGETTLTQQLYGGGSYCSSRQPRLVFGLGESRESCEIEILWPGGARRSLMNVAVDQHIMIKEEPHHD